MSKRKDPNKVYGQTIGVKHYLDLRVKPKIKMVGETRIVTYPLYVRVTAKQQTANFKSVLNEHIATEDFDLWLKQQQAAVDKEAELIRNKILAAKPFDRQDFKISHALSNKRVHYFDLAKRVEDLLKQEIMESIAESIYPVLTKYEMEFMLDEFFIPNDTPDSYRYDARQKAYVSVRNSYNWRDSSAFYHISTLANIAKDDSKLRRLFDKYPVSFWNFPLYCDLVSTQLSEPFYTLEDWISGMFSISFTSLTERIRAGEFSPTVFDSLDIDRTLEDFHTGFKTLCETHPSFQESMTYHLKN
ncbi:MAG: hypothetical protein H7319_15955 [Spirosoma sp.]|nr:hypothetical protein [Spirosoma sp.]